MDHSAVENNQSTIEMSQPADLSVTRLPKCPKSFSIESIIATNDNKSMDSEPVISTNYDKSTNSNVYFPSMAAAASLYNPWFHNYFMQQQKVAGNVFEMMQLNATSQSTIKEKFSEIFSNNSIATDSSQSYISADHDRNISVPPSISSIKQYFGGVENIHEMQLNDMISSANTDYYKHLSPYGINCLNQTSDNMERCQKNQLTNGEGGKIPVYKTDRDRLDGFASEYDKSARNDDSGPDENDDEMDSDCNSEISLDMSPDGDNNTQGIVLQFNYFILYCIVFTFTSQNGNTIFSLLLILC